MSELICADERRIDARARRCAARCSRDARRPRSRWTRPARKLGAGLARALRQLRDGLRRHWDVGVFDLAFGSLKAFGIYPALFALGLGWTIPLAEYAPLNTQLWTAGYLVLRRRIASALGRRRFGESLEQLEARRATYLGHPVSDDLARHHLEFGGERRVIVVRRSRWRPIVRRLRGLPPETDVVAPAELRRWLADPELALAAERHRHNPLLYERVLLHLLWDRAEGRRALEARLQPEARATADARGLEPTLEWTRAVLADQTDRLAARLRGGGCLAWALRFLHGAYGRKIRSLSVDVQDTTHRLLAALAHDPSAAGEPERSRLRRELAGHREQLVIWMRRSEAFVERTDGLGGRAARTRALARELALARSSGLAARRAAAAARLAAARPGARPGLSAALSGTGR
ncbi:MAG: hypothetical protein ACQGVK_06275 [Myxococcota bacterium]